MRAQVHSASGSSIFLTFRLSYAVWQPNVLSFRRPQLEEDIHMANCEYTLATILYQTPAIKTLLEAFKACFIGRFDSGCRCHRLRLENILASLWLWEIVYIAGFLEAG